MNWFFQAITISRVTNKASARFWKKFAETSVNSKWEKFICKTINEIQMGGYFWNAEFHFKIVSPKLIAPDMYKWLKHPLYSFNELI